MRLEIEVEIEDGRHALVDDGAWACVPVSIGVLRVGRKEPGVVALAADDYAEHWAVLWILGIDCRERLKDL